MQISNFCRKSSKVAVELLGYLHNLQFSLRKISFGGCNVDWFLLNSLFKFIDLSPEFLNRTVYHNSWWTIPVWRNSCRTNDDRQIENKLVLADKSIDDKNGDSMNISPPIDSKWLLLKSENHRFTNRRSTRRWKLFYAHQYASDFRVLLADQLSNI